jgi:sigma-B regulation protein RsbU (phosphoserine phosphatase)
VEIRNSPEPDHSLSQENIRLRLAVEELSILNDISTTISSTHTIEKIIDLIIKKCVKHLNVEQGAVMLLDEEDKDKPFHTMIRKQDSKYDLHPYRLDSQLTGWMLKNKSPLLVNDLTNDERFKSVVAKNPTIQSLLSVPLLIKGNLIGILNVFNKHTKKGFSSDDQRLLSIIATQSAQIIENARLYKEEKDLLLMQEEMRLAKETQLNLLPKELPKIPGYSFAAKTIPAKEVGGDYFDFIFIDDTQIAFCLGDVSGKGLPAAMLMSNLQATLRSQSSSESMCNRIIYNSNNLLFRSTETSKFVTLFYGILNVNKNEITFTNAGHNNPLLFSSNTKFSELKTGGIILGCMPDSSFDEETISIYKKDILVIYSDGISEAMNIDEQEYGEERLKKIVDKNLDKSPAEIIEQIISDVRKFQGNTPKWDDMTLLIIKRE